MTALRLAHRGDWRRAPENSLAAMRAALAVPACDGLEFDVRFSSDGVPVLLHDPTLDRVQGVPWACADVPAEGLAASGIPTLADVLVLAAASRPGAAPSAAGAAPSAAPSAAGAAALPFLDVELKALPNDAFFDVLREARGRPDGGLDRAVVSSFLPDAVAAVREREPRWPVWGNVLDLEPATIEYAKQLACRGLSARWQAVDARSARRALDAGLELAAWTVRRRPTFDRLDRLGLVAACVEAAALDGPKH